MLISATGIIARWKQPIIMSRNVCTKALTCIGFHNFCLFWRCLLVFFPQNILCIFYFGFQWWIHVFSSRLLFYLINHKKNFNDAAATLYSFFWYLKAGVETILHTILIVINDPVMHVLFQHLIAVKKEFIVVRRWSVSITLQTSSMHRKSRCGRFIFHPTFMWKHILL